MRKPQTATFERRSHALGIAFSIEMDYLKEKYQRSKQQKHHVLSLAEFKSRLMTDGLLGKEKEARR